MRLCVNQPVRTLARTPAFSPHVAAQLEQYRVQLEERDGRLAGFEARDAARIRLEQAKRKLFGLAELVTHISHAISHV